MNNSKQLFQSILNLGSSRRLYHFCGLIFPWCMTLCLLALGYGIVGALFLAPADYLQGDGFRIIYVHVPCAMLSLLIYVTMAFFSALFLIWHIKVGDIIAYCAAPIGAFFTFCALVTGAIWGKPMWGTWWIWDARLTSELILFFLYLGYIGLYQAIGQKRSAGKACAILAIVGVMDIPIIHYSVYWWSTLHQGSTITKLGQPTIESSMLWPLLSMIIGFGFYTLAVMCVRIKTEILKREGGNRWISALFLRSA